jgi:inhibitor of cysteine peptidase
VKLSLFDVTNVNTPTEIARFVVNASYSDSQALQDPKAFLYDAAKQTLVIPISIMPQIIITPMYVPQPANSGAATMIPAPAPSYWQGAYVFSVNSTSGFTLRGNVTQIDSSNLNNTSYYGGANWINRAAYIGNTLYTFSDSKVQLNNLDTLAFLAEIDLN